MTSKKEHACSPEDASSISIFTHMEITECKWIAHNGQTPDEEQKIRFDELDQSKYEKEKV